MPRVNYVVGIWGGARRASCNEYDQDRTWLIKKHIELLNKVERNLSQITLIVNDDPSNVPSYFNDYVDSLNSDLVKVFHRPNIGISYGSWSYGFEKTREQFDYFIFVEDDFCWIYPNFDDILVNMFEEKENCSYLGGLYTNFHMAMPHGISSKSMLDKVWDKFGALPHAPNSSSYGENSQIAFSNGFNAVGQQYDVLQDYSVIYRNLYRDCILYGNEESPVILSAIQAINTPVKVWTNGIFKDRLIKV
jgi:hypothetical protein